uniref:Uncharacterized protein n=1 Tax=viral metagenome TaxID=1070528 RepID=A0A6C0I4W9_9ZZZZ
MDPSDNKSDLVSSKSDMKSYQKLKVDLEQKGMKQVQQLTPTEKGNPEKLINIMSEGAKEFKEKTGRNMTYSEMREMYG